jgi:hypothetical protein
MYIGLYNMFYSYVTGTDTGTGPGTSTCTSTSAVLYGSTTSAAQDAPMHCCTVMKKPSKHHFIFTTVICIITMVSVVAMVVNGSRLFF